MKKTFEYKIKEIIARYLFTIVYADKRFVVRWHYRQANNCRDNEQIFVQQVLPVLAIMEID